MKIKVPINLKFENPEGGSRLNLQESGDKCSLGLF